MLQAMLRGKLSRPGEGLEDLLTSNTFGLMKYFPPEAALLPFLSRAFDPLSRTFLGGLLDGVVRVERWRFWPNLASPDCIPCQPDVEIILSDGGRKRVGLLIEAKYRSGKSSFACEGADAPFDQLAREFDNLCALAREERFTATAVVYVTPAVACPVKDLEASAREFSAKRGERAAIYWASWRSLPEILEGVPHPFAEMAADARELLLNLGLTAFTRLRADSVRAPGWAFTHSPRKQPEAGTSWAWTATSPAWRFSGGEAGHGESERREVATPFLSFAKPLPRPDKLFTWGAR